MTQNIFISYSRREVGFVDKLVEYLEKETFNIWLDYRSLVPGKPWEEQINQGLGTSDIILLVVSKASIASDNVEFEWRQALQEEKKRIILLVFEAVDLPPELEKYEWVDFRGNYKQALKELDHQLQTPEQEKHSVPEAGFKIPSIVWLAFFLSLIVSIISISTVWTLFIPFFLIQLPLGILKRKFNYMLVQASLLMLPFALYLTVNFSTNEDAIDIVDFLTYVSIPFVIGLIYTLRSEGMQRWGKPEAVAPPSANTKKITYPDFKSVSFFIDHAPQDQKIADHTRKVFKGAGHTEVTDPASADAVFTLVSRFKGDSIVDSQKQVVYPVIIQSNDKISRQLSRVQWLDLRTGVRNLDVVARLLPEPTRLLRNVGIRPMGNQIVLPAVIMYLTYFLAFLAIVCIGSWLPYILQYANEFIYDPDFTVVIGQLAISLILFGGLSYQMVKNIVDRKGFFASLLGLILGMLVLGGIILWQIEIDNMVFALLNTNVEYRGYSAYYPRAIYMVGSLVMSIYLWLKRRDLMFWFPEKK
ncbi:MAG: toll/interleukin-1 receptor domain-containing protein [Anaerolineales bacterium]|nr:toll/interleukin-1 receptor domain-containing protein [Anaerolineales bacterium]